MLLPSVFWGLWSLFIFLYLKKKKAFSWLFSCLDLPLGKSVSFLHILLGAVVYFFSLSLSVGFSEYYPAWGMLVPALFLLILILSFSSDLRRNIFEGSGKIYPWKKSFVIAFVSLLALYPLVIFCSSLIEYFYSLLSIENEEKQYALKILEDTLNQNDFASVLLIAQIIVVIPLCEEILYRGLLQNWVERRLPSKLSVIFTSVIFSLMHLNDSQGWENIKIFTVILLLSLLLGFLYQKTRSLKIPILLHIFFNTIGVLIECVSHG
jgi:uncharacterized protein